MGRTLLFEGEPDHLVPTASEVLTESDLLRVAGRMLAHSFLYDGPHVTGLSPAVVHVQFNGDPETATVVTEDCPDLRIRSIIKLVCIIKNFALQNYCLGKYNSLYGLDFSLNMKNLHRNRRTQFQIFPCLGISRQSPKQIGDDY